MSKPSLSSTQNPSRACCLIWVRFAHAPPRSQHTSTWKLTSFSKRTALDLRSTSRWYRALWALKASENARALHAVLVFLQSYISTKTAFSMSFYVARLPDFVDSITIQKKKHSLLLVQVKSALLTLREPSHPRQTPQSATSSNRSAH